MAPVSASKAVFQPFAVSGGSDRSPGAEPNQIAPADGTVTSCASCTCAHQSTAPVYSVFSVGWNAGPFHSLPPWKPGQKRTRSVRDSGTSTFSRVVVGDWNSVGNRAPSSAEVPSGLRSSTDKRPSLFADAMIDLPQRVIASTGGAFTSQSCESFFTSWL